MRAASIAMQLIGWSAIVPLACGSLLTGLVMSLGTPWGLFRHYWVLITFVLTVFSAVVRASTQTVGHRRRRIESAPDAGSTVLS